MLVAAPADRFGLAQFSSILALKKLKACTPWDGAPEGGVRGAEKRSLGIGCGGAIKAA